jgi:hypothetical protein
MNVGQRAIFNKYDLLFIAEKESDNKWKIKIVIKTCCSNCHKVGDFVRYNDIGYKLLPGQDKFV